MKNNLKIYFDFDNSDDEFIEEEASFIYEDIQDLGIGEVSFDKATDNQRDGKAAGDIIWTTINISIALIAGFKPLLILLENHLNKNERYSVKLKIGENELDLNGVSKEERSELINKFMEKIETDNTGENDNG
jgi:hypothetical protein